MAELFTSSENLDILSNEVNKNLLTTPPSNFTSSQNLEIVSPLSKKENIFTSSNELDVISPPKEEEISITQPDETIISSMEEPTSWEKIAYGLDKQNMFFGNVWRAGKAGLEAAFDPNREFK